MYYVLLLLGRVRPRGDQKLSSLAWQPRPVTSSAPAFNPIAYALDVVLPILDLGQEKAYSSRWVPMCCVRLPDVLDDSTDRIRPSVFGMSRLSLTVDILQAATPIYRALLKAEHGDQRGTA
jgi:hypothetical protein